MLVAARGSSGLALAIAAGLLWAGSDITIKALSGKTDLGLAVVVHPFAFVILVLSLVGLLVSARSLQIGPVVPVIAFTSTTANVLTIAAGPIVFGEPLPDEPLALRCGSRRSRWSSGGGDDAAADARPRHRVAVSPRRRRAPER